MLTYGCEVWGIGDLSFIEKNQTDFLKHILNVKKCPTRNAVLRTWPLSGMYYF